MRIGIQTGTGAVHCVLSAENSGGSTVIKRRDSVSLVLHWIAEDGTGVTALATGSAIHAALRPAGSYSGTPLALCTSFVYSATEKTYTGTLALNTTEMDTAFAALASTADDDLQCALEVTWSADGSAWNSTPRIPVTVENDVVTGSESPPSTSVAPWALPSAGTAGQILQTDGTVATWETHTPTDIAAEIAAAPSHANPADADAVALRVDESGVLGKITWGNVASKFAAASHAASHVPQVVAAYTATITAGAAGVIAPVDLGQTHPAGAYDLIAVVTAYTSSGATGELFINGGFDTPVLRDGTTFGAGSETSSATPGDIHLLLPLPSGAYPVATTPPPYEAYVAIGSIDPTSHLVVSGTLPAENDTVTLVLKFVVPGSDGAIIDATKGIAGILPLANGGTGAATAGAALTNLGATAIGSSLFAAANTADAKTAIGIINMTPAAYTALVVAGTVDATTLYLLTE